MSVPSTKSRVFESYAQAESATGIKAAILRLAKQKGCPAFKQGSRIHEAELLPWISEHAEELKVTGDGLTLKEQKTNEEIRKLKILNDLKEGKLIARDSVVAVHHRFAKALRDLLEQKLIAEYPAMMSGLDIPAGRVYGRNLCDSIVEEIRKLVAQFDF